MTESTATLEQLTDWLSRFRALVTENEEHLTELDAAIGDADHGANMAAGMAAVMLKVSALPAAASIEELFKSVGMTLVAVAGGASGPLYGTFFLRFGMTAGSARALDAVGLGNALRAGLEGIVARGNAEIGDKTMFDAMSPAIDAYDRAVASGAGIAAAASAAFDASTKGRDSTGPLIARKGRANELGASSVGHLDPGASSTALLFEALADAVSVQ